MKTTKINALLTYLAEGKNNYIDTLEISDENSITIDGWEYLVVDEEERYQEFRNFQETLWDDMGLQSFSSWFAQDIINKFLNNEKVYHLPYSGLEVPEEYEDRFSNYVEYVYYMVGADEATDIIKTYNLLEFDEMCLKLIETDGFAQTLARYDGEEIELENGYYAYLIG